MVVSERQHRVHALALAVVERPDLDRVAPAGGDDLQHLVVEFLARRRPGEHETRVHEQALVLVLQVVEQVLGLLLGVLELAGQDLEVIAFLHRAHLLVDDLLVHPRQALLHECDGLGLVHRLDMERDVERHRQVDHIGQAAVRELAAEPRERQHLAPCALREVAGAQALRLEVERRRADEVLRAEPRFRAELLPRERERLSGPEHRVDGAQPLLAVQHARAAPDLVQRLDGVRAHACELGHRRVDVLGAGREGEVALAHQVRDALAHLVVEYPVVLARVFLGVRIVGREEHLAPDLRCRYRGVHDGELHAALGAEVVEELAVGGEDCLLILLARRLVADVLEGYGLAEQPLLDLADAVPVHRVEPDSVVNVLRRCALAPA